MKDVLISLKNIPSHIEIEDYFSLRVVYDSSVEGIRFIGFYNNDEDLLEISVNKDTGSLKKIQITICHTYQIINSNLDINSIIPNFSDLELIMPDHNECPAFMLEIYKDCASINLSQTPPSRYAKCGQAFFGIDNANNIVSIIVTQLTEADRSHIIEELSMQ